MFIPSERRIPKVRIQTRQVDRLVGKRIIVAIDFWPKNSLYPLVPVHILLSYLGTCNKITFELMTV